MVKILAGVSLLLLVVSCKSHQSEQSVSEENKTVAPVKVAHPQQQWISDTIQLSGTTRYLDKISTLSPISGYVKTVSVNVGDFMNVGQPMMILQTREAAAYAKAGIDSLALKGLIAVKSSFHYVVTDIPVHPGDYVQEGTRLLSLVDPSSIVVTLSVPYELNHFFQLQKNCILEFSDRRKISAVVWKRMPVVDSSSQTLECLLKIKSEQVIPENLNVTVRAVKTSPRLTTIVPKTALLTNETQHEFWIMKLENDSVAVKVPVTTGMQNSASVEIISPPLDTSLRIITEGNYGLNDTSLVKIQ
jgi:biotin carboxyl carrier protein